MFYEYLEKLRSVGMRSFTLKQAQKDLNVTKNSIFLAISREKKRGRIFSPVQGFYVMIPPEYRLLGCIPPEELMPLLMEHLRYDYYACLLTAGKYYCAAHQKPAVFQVFVDKRMKSAGGTALHKLFINPPSRYSEDLDFVYTKSEPIGDTLDALRSQLNHWLGTPRRQIDRFGAKLYYRYASESNSPMKLKVEINTTEKICFLPLLQEQFTVESGWFSGSCIIPTYQLEELMATKLRALFQRRKGRYLFDTAHVFNNSLANLDLTISLFQKYLQRDGNPVTGAQFHNNMLEKRNNDLFRTDMHRLLPESVQWSFDEAFDFVMDRVIFKIP